ncbi:type IV pilus twitching motility protein PilT [Acetohalobium arabaticum]|uniref:Twitching motility protein n=1 Tax=Acetohalobium arabaticum (strain ATCC 49924 / DSM 5501 / Z-7288) TaxID=574087 RepID=D9QRY7_ACEAZ|nr:type IV pilus twitching motility protein PilT [Acetohalobium arabaticum]ADL13278.1 twitching motility protein [Acetohalobium arabaticum DSM 5501]
MELDDLLREGIRVGASDIHLTVGIEPTARINGNLRKLCDSKINSDKINGLVAGMLGSNEEEIYKETGEVDFAYHLDNYRFRVNVFKQRGNPAAVLRIIPNEILSLEELGLPEKLKELALKPRGLFLVTGPTGSGKSTTLASMIDLVNSKMDKHIITLEDPIEYVHQHKRSIINQRAVGKDTDNFANGLRSALRQDPDIILVGEMRDLETISTAITAAETGHLVLATLHTNNASETIERIINVFPAHQQTQVRTQLALTLEGVLSQQLLPTIDNLDRVVATELMIANSAVRNLIREDKTHQLESVMQTGSDEGMHTMDYSLRDLYLNGKISRKMALERAVNVETLKKQI